MCRLWLESLRVKDTRLTDEIHVFSSFFFNKLKDKEGIDYNSVKSWSSKFDLFSKKFVFIPINEE
jgi:Ulp1 family protease